MDTLPCMEEYTYNTRNHGLGEYIISQHHPYTWIVYSIDSACCIRVMVGAAIITDLYHMSHDALRHQVILALFIYASDPLV
jgi:hypothetical protein